MNYVLIRVVLFIILRMSSIVFGQTCSSSKDCNLCGVCKDKSPSGTECFYPYPQVEIKSNKCNFKRDLCEKYLCENNGKCQIEFGFSAPVCKCADKKDNKYFTGPRCDMKWDKANVSSWVSGIAVMFDQYKDKTTNVPPYYILLTAAVYSNANNLQFYMETSEGFSKWFNQSSKCSTFRHTSLASPYWPSCQICWAGLPNCKLVYQAPIKFPYKLVPGPGLITKSGNVIGYMANISLVAMSENQEVYRKIHPVMVNYEDMEPDERQHMPVIQLLNCGATLQKRIFYPKRSAISLTAVGKDAPKDSVHAVWKMWGFERFRGGYNFPDLVQANEGYSWTIKPYTLEKIVYRVELQVTIRLASKTKPVTNFADCYIEVVESNIIAIISGGTTITVNNKYQVIISAVKSYNPNKYTTNQNLLFSWSCSPQCNHLISQHAYGQIVIPAGSMEIGKTYSFSLKVSEQRYIDGFTYQEVYVSNVDMSVYCLMNCLDKVLPFDPLLLEVRLPLNAQIQHEFKWNITCGTEDVDTDHVKCKNHTFPSYLLCVDPYFLKIGEVYYFKVDLVDGDAIAGTKMYVGQSPNISCILDPLNGVRLKTSFSISCTNPNNTNSYIFEFFDKFDSDAFFGISGRMLGTNNLGSLRNLKITRGIIWVYLYDTSGLVSQWKQEVNLTSYIANIEDIDGLFNEIEYLIDNKGIDFALKKASLVSELIGPGLDKSYIAEKMVYFISKIPYDSQGIMKLGLVTIWNFIISLTKEGDYKINPDMLKSVTQVIRKVTRWASYVTPLQESAMPSISNAMLQQLATATVETIEVLLANRDESFLDTSLEDTTRSDFENVLEASLNTGAVIKHIGSALSFRQGTGYSKTTITSSTKQSLVTTQTDYLELLAKIIDLDTGFPLKISDKLMEDLNSVQELTVHLTTIKYNPFWTGRRDISTSLLSLDLYNKYTLHSNITALDYINEYIDLFLEVLYPKTATVVVLVTQFDPSDNGSEDVDSQLTIFRINLVSHGKLFFSFSFQDSTGSDKIKIYVSDMLRPDYELVNSSGTVVSSSGPSYEQSVNGGNSDKFVYIGILPGPETPNNGTVNVTLTFYYQLCLTWLLHSWVSQYCIVGPTSNSSIVHCRCSHLSFFSAIFAVPPHEINPFTDIELFLTLKDNWFVAVFMACLLFAFFLLGVWAELNDKKDAVKRKVLILNDNLPGDKNCYLLAVFTGSRVNAGTNANVGVKIIGSESSSRGNILKSSRREVLKRGYEDWFMVQTLQPLGVVLQIHVWQDNTGESPDWYCDKMVVYDLQTSVVYTFFVEQWLALKNSGEFCEALLLPATPEDMDDIKRIVLDNIKFGFRDADKSGSILARHPRSRIDRLDRTVILVCFIMIALLVSLAFYKVPFYNDDVEGFDDFGFSFASQEVLISFQTLLISSALLLLITVTFSKAHKSKRVQRNARLQTQSPKITPSKLRSHINDNSFYYRLVRQLRTTFHPLPFRPVVLSMATNKVKTNRILYAVAWLMSLLLIFCCVFLIILYGLKLGKEESKNWLASISAVLVLEFFVTSPLKILVVAVLLATSFERFAQISHYSVAIEDSLTTVGDENDELNYNNVLKMRKQAMYQPLDASQEKLIRKKLKTKESWHNLLDLAILIAYISIVCLVTYDYSIRAQSHTNTFVAQTMLFKQKPNQVNFQNIYNRTLYYDYLGNTFVAALWVMDEATELVGPPMWRQIRVDPKKCKLNQITKNISLDCIPNWGPGVEDEDHYDFGWKIATRYDEEYMVPNAWRHVLPSQSERVSRQGASWTTYHGGGYMVSLRTGKVNREEVVHTLIESKWINEFTRVIFLDVILFNVNENMFTEIVLIAEHLPFGLYLTRSMIDSVKLDTMVRSVMKVGFVLFILIILFHVVKIFGVMNRQGLMTYFTEFINIYKLFITGLGALSVILFFVHLKVALEYTEVFQKRKIDLFFHFDKIVYYSTMSAYTLTILFCCLSFSLLSLWPFGGNFLNIYHALLLSGKTIMTRFLVLFCVYNFVFCRIFSYLLNSMLPFAALYWHWSKSVHKCSSISDVVVMFILNFLVKLCLAYILMLFCYQYKLRKLERRSRNDFAVLIKWLSRQR